MISESLQSFSLQVMAQENNTSSKKNGPKTELGILKSKILQDQEKLQFTFTKRTIGLLHDLMRQSGKATRTAVMVLVIASMTRIVREIAKGRTIYAIWIGEDGEEHRQEVDLIEWY